MINTRPLPSFAPALTQFPNPSMPAARKDRPAPAAVDNVQVDPTSAPEQISEAVAKLTAALMQLYSDASSCCCSQAQGQGQPQPQPEIAAPQPPSPATNPASQAPATRTPAAQPPVSPASAAQKVGDSQADAQGYAFPVQGYQGEVSLHHGSNRGGSDIFAPRGTPVMAMRGGTVTHVGTSGVGGNNVSIQGDDGLVYYYAHMDQAPLVQQGSKVAAGEQLGVVGDSGNAQGTGTHLHIGIGPAIVTGVGPAGGTGGDFDAIGLLNRTLQAA